MILHYGDTDEKYVVGIFSFEREPDDIVRLFTSVTGITMYECHRDDFFDTGDFHRDTVIISSNQFEEDMLDIMGYDISLYITDGTCNGL